MNLHKFALELLDQCEELYQLRSENAKLRAELEKYEQHVYDELQHWNNTYGSILSKLVEEK